MNTKSQGFTLSELLITVAVIGILAVLTFPSYQRYIRQTHLSNVRTELLQNAKNLERFYAQNGTFQNYKTPLVQNEYFNISFLQDGTGNNPSASGFTLQAKQRPTSELPPLLPKESCIVYLNDSGMFWTTSDGEECPGYEQTE